MIESSYSLISISPLAANQKFLSGTRSDLSSPTTPASIPFSPVVARWKKFASDIRCSAVTCRAPGGLPVALAICGALGMASFPSTF